MDEALSQAKRVFRRRQLRRDQATISGRHPFFWAGITNVGRPGERLDPEQNLGAGLPLLGLSPSLFLLATLLPAYCRTISPQVSIETPK